MKALGFALVLTVLLTMPAPAAGPFDGVWQLLETHPTHGTVRYFASVHQNDAAPGGVNFVVVFVDEFGFWSYGIGSLQGNSFSGVSVDPVLGTHVGTFNLVFSGSAVSGSGNLLGTHAGPVPIAGGRLF
jgi:hypothetical protein